MSLGPLLLLEPRWLAAAPLLLAVVIAFHRIGLIDAPRRVRRQSLLLRCCIIVLLCLALAKPVWEKPSHEVTVIVAVDVSRSIGKEGEKAIKAYLAKLPADGRILAMPFAGKPGQAKPLAGDWSLGESERAALDPDGTNLAAMLEAATASVPPGSVGRVVLLSDGRATEGNASPGKLEVWPVPLPPPAEPDVQVVEIQSPDKVRQNQPFGATVMLRSTHTNRGVLDVWVNGDLRKDLQEEITLPAGTTLIQVPKCQPGLNRIVELKARIRPRGSNRLLDNDTARAIVLCEGKAPMLIVDGDHPRENELKRVLEAESFEVTVLPPERFPRSVEEFNQYELVVLSNLSLIHPKPIPATSLQALKRYVVDLGGGLIVLGGENAYGPGGYKATALEEVLPIEVNRRDEKDKPPHAVILVIDKSGSMQGEPINAARQAAEEVSKTLRPKDIFGVVAFDSSFGWIAQPGPAANQAEFLANIRSLGADNGTVALPALNDALKALRGINGSKHIIFLTDGEDNDGTPAEFYAFADRAIGEKVTLSTVAMGSGANASLLAAIAQRGKGKSYVAASASSLPGIFIAETERTTQSSIERGAFHPRRMQFGGGPTDGLAWNEAPALEAYNVVKTRLEAEEMLLVRETLLPLLATRTAGLGRTAAFTSTSTNLWAGAWLANWGAGYEKFWLQLARHIKRPPDPPGLDLKLTRQGRTTKAVLDAVQAERADAPFLTAAAVNVRIDDSDGSRMIPMPPTAPGRYACTIPADREGTMIVTVTMASGDEPVKSLVRTIAVGCPEELSIAPPNDEALKALARISGGEYDAEPGRVLEPSRKAEQKRYPFWYWCVGAAIVLWVADVARRRIMPSHVAGLVP